MRTIDVMSLPSTPIENKDNLPSISAIYFARQFDEVLYIGKSVNIRKRWRDHHKHSELKLIEGVEISWLECPAGRLDETEQNFIKEFAPPLNYSKKWVISETITLITSPKYPVWIWALFVLGAIGIVLGQAIVFSSRLTGDSFNGIIVRLLLLFGGIIFSFAWGFYYGVTAYHKQMIAQVKLKN